MQGKINRKIVVVLVGFGLLVMVVVGFITPGYIRYKYQKMSMGMFGTQEIRTDRFTGKKQIYGSDNWQPIEIDGDNVHIPEGTQIIVR